MSFFTPPFLWQKNDVNAMILDKSKIVAPNQGLPCIERPFDVISHDLLSCLTSYILHPTSAMQGVAPTGLGYSGVYDELQRWRSYGACHKMAHSFCNLTCRGTPSPIPYSSSKPPFQFNGKDASLKHDQMVDPFVGEHTHGLGFVVDQ